MSKYGPPMKADEVAILKGMIVALDPETVALTTEQYHSEQYRDPISNKMKTDRSKTAYRWLTRVCKLEDLKKTISWLKADENRLNRFKWPNDPWSWYLAVNDDTNNFMIGEWLERKIRKMYDWDTYVKILDGWQTKTANREAGINPSAKYETEGYVADNGDTVSLKDKDALLSHVGQNLFKKHISKAKLAKMAKEAAKRNATTLTKNAEATAPAA